MTSVTGTPRSIPMTIEPDRLCLRRGQRVRMDITLLNPMDEVDLVHLSISGAPPEWIELQHQPVKLPPMSIVTVPVHLTMPRNAAEVTGDRVLMVRASSEIALSRRGLASATWSAVERESPMASLSAANDISHGGQVDPTIRRKTGKRPRHTWSSPRNRSFALALITLTVLLLGHNWGGDRDSTPSPAFEMAPGLAQGQLPPSSAPATPITEVPASSTVPGAESGAVDSQTDHQLSAGDTSRTAPAAASNPPTAEPPSAPAVSTAPGAPAQSAPTTPDSPEQTPVQTVTTSNPEQPAPAPPSATAGVTAPAPVAPEPSPVVTTPEPAPASDTPAPIAPTATPVPPTPIPTTTPVIADAAPPAAPADVAVSPSCGDAQPCSMTISWTDTSTNEAGFKIYGRPGRGSTQDSFDLLATVPAGTTSFVHHPDSGSSRGWCYYVVATSDEHRDSQATPAQCFTGE